MPTKLEFTILGRVAYFINGLKSVNRCFVVVILYGGSCIFPPSGTLATSRVHGHAILHGKPFSNPLVQHLDILLYDYFISVLRSIYYTK